MSHEGYIYTLSFTVCARATVVLRSAEACQLPERHWRQGGTCPPFRWYIMRCHKRAAGGTARDSTGCCRPRFLSQKGGSVDIISMEKTGLSCPCTYPRCKCLFGLNVFML